jgi:hypothetical protein
VVRQRCGWSACDTSVPRHPCPFLDSVAQVFNYDGSPAGAAFLVVQRDPVVAATPDGGALVVWDGVNTDGFTTSIFARLLVPN